MSRLTAYDTPTYKGRPFLGYRTAEPACTTPSKQGYATRALANAHRPKHCKVYLCRCGLWHYTSKTKRRK